MSNDSEGCVQAAKGPITASENGSAPPTAAKEVLRMTARVGHPAPDFEATALHNGKFETVKLSDHFGKWIVLCFYPGDFTFV